LWEKMGSVGSITLDPFSEGCFLKLFFARIATAPSVEKLAGQFADRIANDRPFFSLLLKKYVRVSECNRSLGKTFSEQAQSPEFRRELDSCRILLASEQ
jgi:hypothetical protein